VRPLPRHLLPDGATIGAEGQLVIAGCDTLEVAREFGTPVFVYDEDHIRSRCREAVAAFGDGVVYATKAFLCRAMARLAHEEGCRLDVATGGELHVALSAGVPADRLVFHGNNKSPAELAMALDAGVGRIVVDSFEEVDRIETLVAAGRPAPRVWLRVTPGVEAHTHEFVATGQDDSKFGFTVSDGTAERAVQRASASAAMEVLGLHAHIGSQVFRVESFADAARVVAGFAKPFGLPELTLGGGLGVAYVEGEEAPSVGQWGRVLKAAVADSGLDAALHVEPGRSIVAAAAVTLYTVGTIKELPGIRTYLAVDGGMSDNPRPVLYGSGYETFLAGAVDRPRDRPVRVVGKHCESGDILIREGWVPAATAVGDILATPRLSPVPTATRWARTTTRSCARRSCSAATATPASSSAVRPTTTS
jgi:diaminopimelate decarboxylase